MQVSKKARVAAGVMLVAGLFFGLAVTGIFPPASESVAVPTTCTLADALQEQSAANSAKNTAIDAQEIAQDEVDYLYGGSPSWIDLCYTEYDEGCVPQSVWDDFLAAESAANSAMLAADTYMAYANSQMVTAGQNMTAPFPQEPDYCAAIAYYKDAKANYDSAKAQYIVAKARYDTLRTKVNNILSNYSC